MRNYIERYVNAPGALSLAEMGALHVSILSACEGDEDALDLYRDILEIGCEYIRYRALWNHTDRQTRLELDMDSRRTGCHNTVIRRFTYLARYLESQGRSTAWADTLNLDDGIAGSNRKRIGDFACYLAFAEGLEGR